MMFMSFSLLKSMVGKLNGGSLRKGLEEGGHQQLQHRQLANRLSLARSVRMPLQRLRRLLRQPVRLLQMLPRLHQHVQVLLLVPVLQLLLKCNHRHRQQLCLSCLLLQRALLGPLQELCQLELLQRLEDMSISQPHRLLVFQ